MFTRHGRGRDLIVLHDARSPGEIALQIEFLQRFRTIIFGPPLFGDTYENLMLAITKARDGKGGLTELLLEFGVTDVAGLLFLLRTVSLDTAIQTLLWAGDGDVPESHLHGCATFAHPHITEMYNDDD